MLCNNDLAFFFCKTKFSRCSTGISEQSRSDFPGEISRSLDFDLIYYVELPTKNWTRKIPRLLKVVMTLHKTALISATLRGIGSISTASLQMREIRRT